MPKFSCILMLKDKPRYLATVADTHKSAVLNCATYYRQSGLIGEDDVYFKARNPRWRQDGSVTFRVKQPGVPGASYLINVKRDNK
jgi:hypothetical protein